MAAWPHRDGTSFIELWPQVNDKRMPGDASVGLGGNAIFEGGPRQLAGHESCRHRSVVPLKGVRVLKSVHCVSEPVEKLGIDISGIS
jgi:hypothetical protein